MSNDFSSPFNFVSFLVSDTLQFPEKYQYNLEHMREFDLQKSFQFFLLHNVTIYLFGLYSCQCDIAFISYLELYPKFLDNFPKYQQPSF